jgi:2-polyprenyl-6-methoxyphenol hydroxylase-like FAD-dependent oxidoreductase
VNVVCIGGGPAGLYLGILLKLSSPAHRIRVYERNRADDTFGFGVVFSDATLGNLAAADPVSHASIQAEFAHWDDIEIHHRGEVMVSTGHGFCGIERRRLLALLQARAAALGVELYYETDVPDANGVSDADLIVAADGVASGVRAAFSDQFKPDVVVRPNKFVWLGTTVPFRAFTFYFTETRFGLFRVHAYRYAQHGSTFIVECTDDTWRRAGFEHSSEDETVTTLQRLFANELDGHALLKNRSIWRNFPTVRCESWHARNSHGVPIVLVGDAVHTAHFSIGSGTKLALEDIIALRDALIQKSTIDEALADYQALRRPDVLALQGAAQASLEWFEGTERYMAMSAAQFAYSLMTRSGRVSHQSMRKRDPALVALVETELAVPQRGSPSDSPWSLQRDGRRALHFASRLVGFHDRNSTYLPAASEVAAKCSQRLHAAQANPITWKLQLGDDQLVVIDPGRGSQVIELQLQTLAHPQIAIVVDDVPQLRGPLLAYIERLQSLGAAMIWVRASSHQSHAAHSSRVAAAPLADIIRNQLHVATGIFADAASLADIDAAIAGGRTDVVIVRVADVDPQ